MSRQYLLFGFFFAVSISRSQYAPAAGQPGTTAMHRDSSAFKSWAVSCSVQRGLQDISDPLLGKTTDGDSTMATGKAGANGIVSLGDGGIATCRFQQAIIDGAGHDFAIFENSFNDTYLELAFVEVSSDGVNFKRFPAHSLTDTTSQISFDPMDPTKINNLAGKYRAQYGTPFDLAEVGLTSVSYVRIIDVVGAIDPAYATRDTAGNKINDPWPTPFSSSGFDLDAVGVINQLIVGTKNNEVESISVFPNPVGTNGVLQFTGVTHQLFSELFTLEGAPVAAGSGNKLYIGSLSSGMYILKLVSIENVRFQKVMVH